MKKKRVFIIRDIDILFISVNLFLRKIFLKTLVIKNCKQRKFLCMVSPSLSFYILCLSEFFLYLANDK